MRELKGCREANELKQTRFPLQKNPWNLTALETRNRDVALVQGRNQPFYRAYLLKETRPAILDGHQVNVARRKVREWIDWAARLRKIAIHVGHLPPGTRKWNKVEHRLFSFISINWRRRRPLRSYETVINLISNTTNRGGLVVCARLVRRRYPIGKKDSAKKARECGSHPISGLVSA